MHYRFRITGSRYFKEEPEIIADAPFRVAPGEDLPILLLVKDANRYPIFLDSVEIQIRDSDNPEFHQENHIRIRREISEYWWYQVFPVTIPERGVNLRVMVTIHYRINRRNKSCMNHNLALLKPRPMMVHLAENDFPCSEFYRWGDLHFHSNLTEDMVEFGSPIRETALVADGLGLDFFGITDHSYDLDDLPGSWKERDPTLKKWHDSRAEVRRLNEHPSTVCTVLPAEEVTLMNLKGRNVHALVFNHPEFIPGSGDGAERPFRFQSEYTTKSLGQLLSKDSLVIAAHPFVAVPPFQWVLIKRGKWEWEDIILPHINGLQILNGSLDEGFFSGIQIWKKLLLEGYQKFIYAGNDAHGNFNFFRQIKTPMISLH
jgi:hypothetical protein